MPDAAYPDDALTSPRVYFAMARDGMFFKRIAECHPTFLTPHVSILAITVWSVAGKKFPNFLFVIWGTGVGGGIILKNKIFRGPTGGAGEIGHITVDYNGPQCNCGSNGCVESYVGQRYLSQRTVERLKNHPESKILQLVDGNLEKVEPVYIAQAAKAGDKFAKEVLVEAGTILGIALGAVMNTMDLRVSIIGGGISAAGDFVMDAIKQSVQYRVLKPLRPDIQVLPAKLGNDAGILGAAGLVL